MMQMLQKLIGLRSLPLFASAVMRLVVVLQLRFEVKFQLLMTHRFRLDFKSDSVFPNLFLFSLLCQIMGKIKEQSKVFF